MSCYARFEKIEGEMFRLDTRIYLDKRLHQRNDGECIAAIVAKNPGSACPVTGNKWNCVDFAGDKLLPYVENRFRNAYQLAGKKAPENAFISVWNLFYLCNKDLKRAIDSLNKMTSKALQCDGEKSSPPIVWFAWGGPIKKLDAFKARFQNLNISNPFYFDKNAGQIAKKVPLPTDFARHTQGLTAKPMEEHLASIL